MLSQVEYIRIFNQLIDEFFRELIDIFPEETKIKVQHNLFQSLCKSNFKKPCTDFMLGSIDYLEKISMKDEDFFKGTNKPDLLTSMNFEKLWTPELSPVTKEAIWKYIKSFFAIGVNAIQMPEESLPLIYFIINQK
jgi:hypothetical protein